MNAQMKKESCQARQNSLSNRFTTVSVTTIPQQVNRRKERDKEFNDIVIGLFGFLLCLGAISLGGICQWAMATTGGYHHF